MATVVSRLLAGLEAPTPPSAGSIFGHVAYWVLSLAEVHFTLYVAFVDGKRLLFWQSADAKTFHAQTLMSAEWTRWRAQIENVQRGLVDHEVRAT